MRTIITKSGARYEADDIRIRRVNDSHEKRGDGEWLNLAQSLPGLNLEGQRLLLVLDSLASRGSDDYGTPPEAASPYTYRRTTEVVYDSFEKED